MLVSLGQTERWNRGRFLRNSLTPGPLKQQAMEKKNDALKVKTLAQD